MRAIVGEAASWDAKAGKVGFGEDNCSWGLSVRELVQLIEITVVVDIDQG